MKTNSVAWILVVVLSLAVVSFGRLASAEDASADEASIIEREPAAVSPQTAPPQRRRLTEDEADILRRGPISTGRYVGGGVTGSIVGFGIGHAIQGGGRYGSRGWIFTVGELGSLTVAIAAASNCRTTTSSSSSSTTTRSCYGSDGLIALGFIGLIGLHVWEVIDLWVAPPRQNRRYEEFTSSQRNRVSFRMAPTMVSETTPGLAMALDF